MTSRELRPDPLRAPCPVLPCPLPSYALPNMGYSPQPWQPLSSNKPCYNEVPQLFPRHIFVTTQQRLDMANAVRRSSRICRHFVRGICTWGASCRFSHDFNDTNAEVSPQSISAEPEEEAWSPSGPTESIVISTWQHQPY